MSARSLLASAVEALASVGCPDVAAVSAPSAPLVSRVLADRRTILVTRRGSWLVALVTVVALAVYASVGLAEKRWPDSLPVAAASTLLEVATILGEGAVELVSASPRRESGFVPSPSLTAAVLVPALAVALVVTAYRVSDDVEDLLDVVHERLLGLLPGVHAWREAPGLAAALAEVRSLRTETSDAFVERAIARREEYRSLVTNTPLLRTLTSEEPESLVAAARRGCDDGLVDDVLRLSLLLPLETDYGAIVGTDSASLEARHDDVRRAIVDLVSGAPVEWVVRRAAAARVES